MHVYGLRHTLWLIVNVFRTSNNFVIKYIGNNSLLFNSKTTALVTYSRD